MAISFHDVVRDAEDRLELTEEEGWIERMVHPAAGNMDHRISTALARLGVPDEWVFKNTRLVPMQVPSGKTVGYAPDAMVVRPDNPVPCQAHHDYAGVPDLVVEILGGDPKGRRVDRREKRRNYALRGIPHYWLVDPDAGVVTWLQLVEGAYVEQWTRPLAEVALPW
jgi:Uma2 family endonuclease